MYVVQCVVEVWWWCVRLYCAAYQHYTSLQLVVASQQQHCTLQPGSADLSWLLPPPVPPFLIHIHIHIANKFHNTLNCNCNYSIRDTHMVNIFCLWIYYIKLECFNLLEYFTSKYDCIILFSAISIVCILSTISTGPILLGHCSSSKEGFLITKFGLEYIYYPPVITF